VSLVLATNTGPENWVQLVLFLVFVVVQLCASPCMVVLLGVVIFIALRHALRQRPAGRRDAGHAHR